MPIPSIPPETRAYYREVWGFDPVTDARPLRDGDYYYWQEYSLDADPYLSAAGVKIAAVVTVYQGDTINRIRFSRGKRSRAVECTHTIVYVAPAADVLTYADDLALGRALSDADRKLLDETGGSVPLPPWEHFAALKSFVGAVAEVGLGNIFQSAWERDFSTAVTYPFSFNIEMQRQVIAALAWVAPRAARALVRDFILAFIEKIPPEWLKSRESLLAETFNFGEVFLSDPDSFALVEDKFSPLMWRDLAVIYGRTAPSIQARISTLYKQMPVKCGAWLTTSDVIEWLESHPSHEIIAFPHDLSLGFVDIFKDEGKVCCASKNWQGSAEDYFGDNFAKDFEDVTWIICGTINDLEEEEIDYEDDEPTFRRADMAEWPGSLAHNFATIHEIAQHAPPSRFSEALAWLDDFLEVPATLCARTDFFTRVDASNRIPLLRLMAVLPINEKHAIFNYVTKTERQDLGIIAVALQYPWISSATEQKLLRRKENLLRSNSDRIWYCGEEISRQDAFALARLQEGIGDSYLLPNNLFCLHRVRSSFKVGFFEVKEGQVERLWLNNLQLYEVPPEIWAFPRLFDLELDKNNLTSLPEIKVAQRNLMYLHLENNKITSLPSSLHKLTDLMHIILSFNNLETIPDAIAHLHSKVYIKWDHNHVTSLSPSVKAWFMQNKTRVFEECYLENPLDPETLAFLQSIVNKPS